MAREEIGVEVNNMDNITHEVVLSDEQIDTIRNGDSIQISVNDKEGNEAFINVVSSASANMANSGTEVEEEETESVITEPTEEITDSDTETVISDEELTPGFESTIHTFDKFLKLNS